MVFSYHILIFFLFFFAVWNISLVSGIEYVLETTFDTKLKEKFTKI